MRIPNSRLPHRCVIHNKIGQSSFESTEDIRRDVPCVIKQGKNLNRGITEGIVLYDAIMTLNIEDVPNEGSSVLFGEITYTVRTVTPVYDKFFHIISYAIGLQK